MDTGKPKAPPPIFPTKTGPFPPAPNRERDRLRGALTTLTALLTLLLLVAALTLLPPVVILAWRTAL